MKPLLGIRERLFCANEEKRKRRRGKKSQGRKRRSSFSPLKSSSRSLLSFPSYRKSQPSFPEVQVVLTIIRLRRDTLDQNLFLQPF
jgi:hypothetical protein